jgi:hypothetical protein
MNEGCDHGQVRDCRVIEVLADHSECVHEVVEGRACFEDLTIEGVGWRRRR